MAVYCEENERDQRGGRMIGNRQYISCIIQIHISSTRKQLYSSSVYRLFDLNQVARFASCAFLFASASMALATK